MRHQDAAPVRLVVDVGQQVEALDHPAPLFQGAGQPGRAVAGLQRADQPCGLHGAELERSGQAKQVVPVLFNERHLGPVPCQAVQGAVVGLGVHAPEARAADVGQARAELEAKQVEDAEHDVGVGAGVCHHLRGLEPTSSTLTTSADD